MKLLNLLLASLVGSALLMSPVRAQEAKEKPAEKLVEIEIQDIKLKLPESWKQQPPENKLRLAQFTAPMAEGDNEAPTLVVSSFAGGTAAQNLGRWTAEFKDSVKITTKKGESPLCPYEVTEISGSYVGPSFRRRPAPLENGRAFNFVLMPKEKPFYYLKLTGPTKSVEAAAKTLRAAFGADDKKEKDVERE